MSDFNFNSEIEAKLKNLDKLNIVVVGKTGVGKSTLLNAVFGQELAKTGSGAPVTQHINRHTLPNSPVTIYDTKGLETGKGDFVSEIYGLIDKQNFSKDHNQFIHICWYCILNEGKRIEPNEIKIIKSIFQKIPIVIVVTQSVGGNTTDEFVKEIKAQFENNKVAIFIVMAKEMKLESEYGSIAIKQHGLEKLLGRSYQLLPESVKQTFVAYEKNLDLKIRQAYRVCGYFADAVALSTFAGNDIGIIIMVAIQIGMIVDITVYFGISPSKLNLESTLQYIIKNSIDKLHSLLEFIPIFGENIAKKTNAKKRAGLTMAIGLIYIETLEAILRENREIDTYSIGRELKKEIESIDIEFMGEVWDPETSSVEEIKKLKLELEIDHDFDLAEDIYKKALNDIKNNSSKYEKIIKYIHKK